MGDQVVLEALKNELKKAKQKESRIKLKVKHYMSAGSDIIDARKAAIELMKGSMDNQKLKDLDRLVDTEKGALKALKLDAVKLFDDEFNASQKVREIEEEIHMIEWRREIRRGG